jgi:hypothetical protein
MNLDLLHGWEASTPAFKLAVLLVIAAAYVLFELLLAALARRSSAAQAAMVVPAELAELAIEAYRPVTSWPGRE